MSADYLSGLLTGFAACAAASAVMISTIVIRYRGALQRLENDQHKTTTTKL